nr:MAG TPA_asm: hypothetical protein [Caudoviricetes sp.]
MADPSPGRGGVEWFADEFAKLRARLDSLESPSGTQLYNTVSKLQALVEDIQAQLDAWATTRWTNAQIDSRIDQKIAAAFAGNVTITGSLTVNGAVAAASLSTGGSLTVGGAVTLPDVYNTDITTMGGLRQTVWVRDGGRMGHT